MKKNREDIPFYLITIFMVIAYFFVNNIEENVPAYAHLNEQPIVIIDAGHGGEDGGASTADGTLEKDINLKIALYLKDILHISGYDVIMTREDDSSQHSEFAVTIREKKISDMDNRLSVLNENPSAIFVSIHQNKFTEEYCSGAQVFYNTGNNSGKALAEQVQNQLRALLDPQNDRIEKSSGEEYYLLNYSENPGVIIECGFLSNNDESEKLKSSDYQKKIAFAIFSGIDAYNNEMEYEFK